ncbi:MAG: hypothetical protein DU481_08140 [Nitrosomonas sp.]|uniref:hypothetical protein n=1 Tax=Nitrosomonas sp. TaxID=42353 RepID=UPI0032F0188D
MQTREERDTMGVVELPAVASWGAQAQRSLQNFKISGECMPMQLIHGVYSRVLIDFAIFPNKRICPLRYFC